MSVHQLERLKTTAYLIAEAVYASASGCHSVEVGDLEINRNLNFKESLLLNRIVKLHDALDRKVSLELAREHFSLVGRDAKRCARLRCEGKTTASVHAHFVDVFFVEDLDLEGVSRLRGRRVDEVAQLNVECLKAGHAIGESIAHIDDPVEFDFCLSQGWLD